LGAIRLFLACGVLFWHMWFGVLTHLGLTATASWWLNIIGGRAVIFFYVVSGFLISYALHEKYPSTAIGTLAFYRSRFLRIFPLWWAMLAICLVINIPPWPGPHSPWVLAPAVLLLGTDWIVPFWSYPEQYWGTFPQGLGIGWTLGAELTFYLIAPYVLRSWKLALALFALSAATRAGVALTVPISAGTYVIWSYFFFPATLMFFLLGHFANMLRQSLPLRNTISIATLALALFLSWIEPRVPVDRFASYASCVCFAAALPGIFAATKDSRILNFLGDLTYPLYLTHPLTIAALFWPWEFLSPLRQLLIQCADSFGSSAAGGIFLIVAVFFIAMPVAAVAHFAIERPARSLATWVISYRPSSVLSWPLRTENK
jgi:peptidoglycan/LPS O-acetylase OafA/YrhL